MFCNRIFCRLSAVQRPTAWSAYRFARTKIGENLRKTRCDRGEFLSLHDAATSPPHLHANGVMAFVVSGTIVSKVGNEAEQTFHAGDAWWEPPDAIHRVSRNASSTEPATLLAIYVAPKSATADDLMKPI